MSLAFIYFNVYMWMSHEKKYLSWYSVEYGHSWESDDVERSIFIIESLDDCVLCAFDADDKLS